MFRLLVIVIYNTATWFQFLNWAWGQTEMQIDKMQEAAFDSPGVEPPVRSSLFVALFGVITGHFTVSRILRLRTWQSILGLCLGVAAGAALAIVRPKRAF